MFFAIFINMNKSAALKLDKIIQEIMNEQYDPNRPFSSSFPKSPKDPQAAKKAAFTMGPGVQPGYLDPEQKAANDIAKTIYDAKGTFSDDMYLAVKAIKQIKDVKQFELVQTALQKLTNGRGIGTYIVSFLGTKFMGADLNLVETLRDGETIVKHLKSIKADPATIKFINDRIVQASIQKAITPVLATAGVPGAQALQAVNSVSMWSYEHNTWDTMINGANGKDDGLRGVAYSVGGIVVTTILAAIPETKAAPVVIFGLLAVDDVYQIVKGNGSIETWTNLLIDLLGAILTGGVSSGFKSAFRPIAALMNAVSKGAKSRVLIPLVENVQKMTAWVRSTKFGQLLLKLGEDFVTFAVSLIKNLCTQFVNALKLVAKKHPRLMGWCQEMINEIAWHIQEFAANVKEAWAALKILWKVISLPGKSADWIVQNVILRKANVVVRGAFGVGAKVYVNVAGLQYILAPDVEKQLNQELADAEEKAIANIVSAHAGNIIGFPKTGNKIYVYLKDDAEPGGYLYAGSRETFYVPVTMGDSTTLQPVGVRIHQDTKNGHWVQISMTKNIEEYNRGKFGETEKWWTDARQLIQLNRVPIDKYITITPIKENKYYENYNIDTNYKKSNINRTGRV